VDYEEDEYIPCLFLETDSEIHEIGFADDFTYDTLLNYIKHEVVRIKEEYKALNITFEAVCVRFEMSEYCLHLIEGLAKFLDKVPYITPEDTPPIFFSR
jgi:hypothetical protein